MTRSFDRSIVRACAGALAWLCASSPVTQALASEGYRAPDADIAAMIAAQPAAQALVESGGRRLALLVPDARPSVARLAAPTLRLAGFRIDPRTRGPAETDARWYVALSIVDTETGATHDVMLPQRARATFPQWSPDGRRLAFVVEREAGLELWLATGNGQARAVTGPELVATFGTPYAWAGDDAIVVAVVASTGPPPAPRADDGPTVQEVAGRAAAARTFGDLLRSPADESAFEHWFTSRLVRVSVLDGARREVAPPGLHARFEPSPDGRWLLVERRKRPYSYVVPAARFATEIDVRDRDGRVVLRVVDRPLADALPPVFLAVPMGPREVGWRADAPATLAWLEAQDGGDPRRDAPVRDRLRLLPAPFDGPPRDVADFAGRPYATYWGDEHTALVVVRWWATRLEQLVHVDPSGRRAPHVVLERNLQARHDDPGEPILRPGPHGRAVLRLAPGGRAVDVAGDGATRDGERPYLAQLSLRDGKLRRKWQADEGAYESVLAVRDGHPDRLITRRERSDLPPQYLVRDVRAVRRVLHATADPAPAMANVEKRLLTYPRDDGVLLSGTLYLPPGHRVGRDPPLPTLLWVYPVDFTDASVASQAVDTTRTRFSRPEGLSPLYLVLRGYAVFDGPTMPIVGRDGREPNDTYVEQLTASAEAAVRTLVDLGVSDARRIAVGGHSYGAFTAANLLAHTDLFVAGLAYSGAYNRTLTPFGFQAEQRTYWQAPEVYEEMSPFTHAARIREPLLLVHGAADENAGTQPQQSERLFGALRGLGGTARYVSLPFEMHRYRALESLLHATWEMQQWLDRHLKPSTAAPEPESRP